LKSIIHNMLIENGHKEAQRSTKISNIKNFFAHFGASLWLAKT